MRPSLSTTASPQGAVNSRRNQVRLLGILVVLVCFLHAPEWRWDGWNVLLTQSPIPMVNEPKSTPTVSVTADEDTSASPLTVEKKGATSTPAFNEAPIGDGSSFRAPSKSPTAAAVVTSPKGLVDATTSSSSAPAKPETQVLATGAIDSTTTVPKEASERLPVETTSRATAAKQSTRQPSSLNVLMQFYGNSSASDDTQCWNEHASSNTTTRPPLSTVHDPTFFNCEVMYDPPRSSHPLALLECPHYQPLLDNQDMIIIPRSDLFQLVPSPSPQSRLKDDDDEKSNTRSSTSTSVAATVTPQLLGSVFFHFTQDGGYMMDGERFLCALINNVLFAWYPSMGVMAAKTLHCTYQTEAGVYCACPKESDMMAYINGTKRDDSNTSAIVHTNRDQTTILGVEIPHFFPEMYQLPTLLPEQNTSSSSSKSDADNIHQAAVDPVTPSVALFRKAYAEMSTGRIFVATFADKHSCPDNKTTTMTATSTTPSGHREYLIQMNQCIHRPAAFALPITAATTVETSGVTRVFDRIILLTAIWSPAFYHSTIEQLPRLLFISDFIEANPNITVVARKNDDSLDQDALFYIYAKVWNLESRILFLEDKDVIYANLMYIPEPSPCGALQPLMAQITQSAVRAKVASVLTAKRQGNDAKVVVPNARQRRRLGSSVASTPNVAKKSREEYDNNHIVVVRRRGNRGLRNHDELLTTLQTTFPNETWFDFDDGNTTGTFPSVGLPQWTAFAQAKIIVAPHGAGLSNMIGCRPGTHIVELFGDGYDLNLCYLHLTVGLNMNHHPLIMDNHDQNGQYNANVANVVKIVKDILQMQAAAATAG